MSARGGNLLSELRAENKRLRRAFVEAKSAAYAAHAEAREVFRREMVEGLRRRHSERNCMDPGDCANERDECLRIARDIEAGTFPMGPKP